MTETERALRREWDSGPIAEDDDVAFAAFESALRRYEAEEDAWREIEDGD